MSDTDKPMPCPFCGCNKIDRYLPLHRDEPQYSCAETTCAAHALHTSLKKWNTRASAEQPDHTELISRLEAIGDVYGHNLLQKIDDAVLDAIAALKKESTP